MRTSQFAKKHGVNQSTVGFYIKQGLLLPTTVNGKFDFRETDHRDMQLITDLKQWQFNLDDISTILSDLRLTQHSAQPDSSRYLDMLHQRQQELLAEQRKITASLQSLEETIQVLQIQKKAPAEFHVRRGIDVQFLPFFYCPNCFERLTVHLERIEEGQIHSGRLTCACSYQASIEEGIIINAPGNLPQPPRQKEHTEPAQLSRSMRNYLYRAYSGLEEMLQISALENKLIIETYVGTSSFLLQKARIMNPSCLYVFCDPVQAEIQREKTNLDTLDQQLNILAIATNNQHFPLKRGCVDYIIDCFQNAYFDMFTDSFVFPRWLRYLHRGSCIIGVFMGVSPHSKSARQFKALHPKSSSDILNVQAFQRSLQEHGFHIEQEKWVEPLTDSAFPWHHSGDELHYYCYCAKLKQDPDPPKII